MQTKDYMHPEKFVCNAGNTKLIPYKTDLKQFEETVIKPCEKWYQDHILSGVSPKMTDKDKQWFIQKIGFVE
jgi:hypothetical protein